CARRGSGRFRRSPDVRGLRGGTTRAFELAAVPLLRDLRGSNPGHDDRDVVRPPGTPGVAHEGEDAAVRVGGLRGRTAPRAALHGELLPHADPVHPLRHRDRLPVPAGRPARRARLVRGRRAGRVRRDTRRRVRLRMAEGSAQLALKRELPVVSDRPLAKAGLQSERVLMPDRGPGVFEREVEEIEDALLLTTVEKAVAWARSHSVWPDTFGLACCAIEMMSIVSSRYDIARFGMERFSSSPRQADLLIVSGRVTHKMAAPIRQVYDQMLEPKWVIAMGACASSGGMFNNYTILQGVDKIVPVDVHVPGC